ncbi:MAG: tail fiber protein [Actinobacteria bacterium]|nr:tail fiber protein [Actinomycetota bacterium]
MTIILNKTDPSNQSITLLDGQTNQTTPLTFLGKNYSQGYSKIIGENFLHLLENFSFNNPPENPVQGQLWFNNNVDVEIDSLANTSRDSYGIKVFDGQNWLPIGIVKKFAQPPTIGGSTNLNTGDLFVDTERQQLYISNGSDGWTLVGPSFNAAEKTGMEIEYIVDSDSSIDRPILSIFVKTKRIVVISDYEFVPKSLLTGFRIIKQGINLSTEILHPINQTKFWGVAEKAESLISGDEIVLARNFLRSDQSSTTNFSFQVRNNNGISIGNDLSLILGADTSGSFIYNKLDGASIDLRLRKDNQIKNILRCTITPNNISAVGINNLVPEETLDVIGNIKTNQRFITSSTQANSISTQGGISVLGNATIGQNLTVTGTTILSNIEPNADDTKNLGSENKRWNTIYAGKIGTNTRRVVVNGTLNGDVNGNISGYSTGFSAPITITLTGDVTGTVSIQKDNESKNLVTTLKSDFISQKPETSVFQPNDLLLIERNQGLLKIKRSSLVNQLPLVPVGTIILWAGDANRIPKGYLICDGAEVEQYKYQTLYSVIGYTYKNQVNLTGTGSGFLTFALPDLRPSLPSYKPNQVTLNLNYTIIELGNTDWISMGLSFSPAVNTTFNVQSLGEGTGKLILTNGPKYLIYTGNV